MSDMTPIMRELIMNEPECANIAHELVLEGTFDLIDHVDLAELGAMRNDDAMLDLSQIISMGGWDSDERFMMWMYDQGVPW